MGPKQSCCITSVLFMVLALFVPGAGAQQRRIERGGPPVGADDSQGPSPSRSMSRKMLKASYDQLQKDVQKLSDLASELKEEVTTDDEDVLSLSGVKKAEEIEKLAKKIQSRMKNL